MFQDIAPHRYRVEYEKKTPTDRDLIFIVKKDSVLMKKTDGVLKLPQYAEAQQAFPQALDALVYLFAIDDTGFYLSFDDANETEFYHYQHFGAFRELQPEWLAFGCATAFHLATWYDTNRHCGRCAAPMVQKDDERAMVCPVCHNLVFPKIAPVVIVAVTDGDKLLLTKYASGYTRYALVAGFAEIGEALEDTVRREVMEEVGLKVKNIRYYKSQPWAFSGSLLSGFIAELDGDNSVTVDQKELSEAVWLCRADIPDDGSTMSLTWTMVEAFKNGEI